MIHESLQASSTITDADDAAATPLTQIVNVSIARLTLQKEDFAGAPLQDAVFRLSGDTFAAATYTVDDDGTLTIPELQDKAKLTVISSTSIVEGGAHDVLLKDKTPFVSNTR